MRPSTRTVPLAKRIVPLKAGVGEYRHVAPSTEKASRPAPEATEMAAPWESPHLRGVKVSRRKRCNGKHNVSGWCHGTAST